MTLPPELIEKLAMQVWGAGDQYIGPSSETMAQFAALVAEHVRAEERELAAKACEQTSVLTIFGVHPWTALKVQEVMIAAIREGK